MKKLVIFTTLYLLSFNFLFSIESIVKDIYTVPKERMVLYASEKAVGTEDERDLWGKAEKSAYGGLLPLVILEDNSVFHLPNPYDGYTAFAVGDRVSYVDNMLTNLTTLENANIIAKYLGKVDPEPRELYHKESFRDSYIYTYDDYAAPFYISQMYLWIDAYFMALIPLWQSNYSGSTPSPNEPFIVLNSMISSWRSGDILLFVESSNKKRGPILLNTTRRDALRTEGIAVGERDEINPNALSSKTFLDYSNYTIRLNDKTKWGLSRHKSDISDWNRGDEIWIFHFDHSIEYHTPYYCTKQHYIDAVLLNTQPLKEYREYKNLFFPVQKK